MSGDDFAGIVIMAVCCFGSAALFFSVGVWAERRKKPMNFWAGTEIDPKTVSDIPAYNHENAVMWKLYSIPYWLAGLVNLLPIRWSDIASLILLALACLPGLPLLILRYKQIEKKYILR